ncbi:hypothetical protein KLP28_13455 [Nocardioidaceae bacterium]|nr:hypothetical protein KLP28_13455 [Nocardioidaceae bacterium]
MDPTMHIAKLDASVSEVIEQVLVRTEGSARIDVRDACVTMSSPGGRVFFSAAGSRVSFCLPHALALLEADGPLRATVLSDGPLVWMTCDARGDALVPHRMVEVATRAMHAVDSARRGTEAFGVEALISAAVRAVEYRDVDSDAADYWARRRDALRDLLGVDDGRALDGRVTRDGLGAVQDSLANLVRRLARNEHPLADWMEMPMEFAAAINIVSPALRAVEDSRRLRTAQLVRELLLLNDPSLVTASVSTERLADASVDPRGPGPGALPWDDDVFWSPLPDVWGSGGSTEPDADEAAQWVRWQRQNVIETVASLGVDPAVLEAVAQVLDRQSMLCDDPMPEAGPRYAGLRPDEHSTVAVYVNRGCLDFVVGAADADAVEADRGWRVTRRTQTSAIVRVTAEQLLSRGEGWSELFKRAFARSHGRRTRG